MPIRGTYLVNVTGGMILDLGDRAPDFCLQSTGGDVCLADLHVAGPAVLVFYTTDFTPLCTNSLNVLADEFSVLKQLNATVIAISADSVESHLKFAEVNKFPFDLASDPSCQTIRAYGVLNENGASSNRAIVCVDQEGVIVHLNKFFQPTDSQQVVNLFSVLGY
jgi:peroxiredoxin Q/BCP